MEFASPPNSFSTSFTSSIFNVTAEDTPFSTPSNSSSSTNSTSNGASSSAPPPEPTPSPPPPTATPPPSKPSSQPPPAPPVSPPPAATPPPSQKAESPHPPAASPPPESSPPPPAVVKVESPPPLPTAVPVSPPPIGDSPPPVFVLSPPPPAEPAARNTSTSPELSVPPTSTPPATVAPPPPPATNRTSPSSSTTSSSKTTDSNSTSTQDKIIIGVVAGAGLILLVMLLYCTICATRRRKRKREAMQMQYYGDHPKGVYYSGGPLPSMNPHWPHNPNHIMKVPPPPGSGWTGPQMTSGEMIMSGSHSGSHHHSHNPLPPPSPGLSLGFNQSTFTYDELAAASNGFSQSNLLGQGGFGYVHKGVLPNGKEIAIKSLKSGSGQGDREFQAEVEIISRVHHRHLVSLVGYCVADGRRMLVYEFVPNNTLEHHLYGKGVPSMDWTTRLVIALGSAKGLAYLHEDCHPRIIHRDIKAANILIENNFEAKVADFGLAKLSSDNYTHVSTRVMGTFGYMAPEYASSGKLTEKSDVFSFGVMLLELITGRRPIDTTNSYMDDSLVDWARPIMGKALEEGNFEELVDHRLENNYNREEMGRLVSCAATAVRHSAKRRPKMSQIVQALQGQMTLDDISEGVKQYSSTESSSDYDTKCYNADMQKFRKVVMASQEYGSSEFGGTSEYGLNPSTSSSDSQDSKNQKNHSRIV